MAHILVAEDERDIRELINFTLVFAGHQVTQAANGAEAVELAPKVKPDLIMMDVRMPKMTGYDVAERLRKRDRLTPILLITGKEDDVLVTPHAHHAGINDVLFKPIDPPALLAKVRELTAGRAAHGTG